jgi:hypothetical protein
MKTIFTLFASLFMSIAVFAAARPNSILTIKSVDNADIRVVLDGKRFQPNDNSIMFGSMEPGQHQIKIFRKKRNAWFNMNGSRYELVYNTTIDLKRRTHLFITVERNGRISMMENRISRDYDRNDNRDNGYGRNDRNNEWENDGQWGDYDHHEGYARPMSDRDFSNVLHSIKKEWLESNKFKSASQIIKTNNFTTAQVEQILLLFSFENNKLELAKQAYMNTIDKGNYHRLYDVFSFNSSKKELEKYIDSCH